MSINYCTECKERLQPGNNHCSCGWNPEKNKSNKEKQTSFFDDRKGFCEWEYQDRQCPAIGNHSKSLKGGGPWYCMDHIGDIDLVEGLKIIYEYEKNGVPVRVVVT